MVLWEYWRSEKLNLIRESGKIMFEKEAFELGLKELMRLFSGRH